MTPWSSGASRGAGTALLTPDLLRWRSSDGRTIEPAWLSERDDVWLRELIAAIDGRVGHPVGELERELRGAMDPICRAERVDIRALRGVIRVALKDYTRVIAADVPPDQVRALVFREAARIRHELGGLSESIRRRVIEQAAGELDLTPEAVEATLYADYPRQRLLEGPADLPAPATLRDKYQLALLQGFLLRSAEVRLWVRSHVRAVARFAKLSRLLCTFALEGDSTRMDLSGPLALFHSTLKYGRALATFLPSVVSTPGWRLEAQCALPEGPLAIRVDASAPLPRTHALPKDADSKLESQLARDLRRLKSTWTLRREAEAYQAGGRAFFPDFLLTRGDQRVVVEVVGFWTPEYLSSKLRALASLRDVPLVVAVDATHGVLPEHLPLAELVTFKKRVDAATVVAAAERACGRRGFNPQ